VNNFSTGGNKIDYVGCMRKFLTQSESKMGRTSSSAFQPRATTQAREIKPRHPWEFEYKRLQNAGPDMEHPSHIPESSREKGTLYWQQACAAPRADVKKAMLDPMHQRGKKINAADLLKSGYSDREKARLFNQFENNPKLFHLFRKTYKAIGSDSNWKRIRSEFKKVAEAPRPTSIKNSIDVTTDNFHDVLHEFHLDGITNSDVYTLSHAFRGKGMPEVVRVDEFWATLKIIDADDKQRGFDWEADDRARAQHDIDALAAGF
jgi:hypothetical protein